MMQHLGLGGGSWGDVFLTASYLRNRGPVNGMLVTPQEMWSGKKPDIAHIRSYGCKVFCPIDKKDRGGKLGALWYEKVMVGCIACVESPRGHEDAECGRGRF